MSDRNTPKLAAGSLRARSTLSQPAQQRETPIRNVASTSNLLASGQRSTSQAIAQLDSNKATPSTTSRSLGASATSVSTAAKRPATASRLPTAASASGSARPTAAARRMAAQAAAAPNTPECLARRGGAAATDYRTPVVMHRNLSRANTGDDLRPKAASSNTSAAAKETPSAEASHSGQLSKMKVFVRVRPLNARELAQPGITNALRVRDNAVIAKGGSSAATAAAADTANSMAAASNSSTTTTNSTTTYYYDRAFWGCNEEHPNYADQQRVFEETAMPLLDSAFEGYNGCLFAYGMTGSGKSFSMMGIDADDNLIDRHSSAGIIPRFCQELFTRIESMQPQYRVDVEVSYYEVYNERIHDLLTVGGNKTQAARNSRPALRVREHPIYGPYVVDLSTYSVESHTDLRNWLAVGNSQRATAATELNDQSSRSHSIFNIGLTIAEQRRPRTKKAHQGLEVSTSSGSDEEAAVPFVSRRSKISLVDLAGSERQGSAKTDGERLNEGKNINKSLLYLGIVIASLSKKSSASTYVPYRESQLTFLLKENLGGNSRTVMLATVSPASSHIDETLCTLRYACQARSIVNRVRVNEDKQDRRIREMRAEIERLQAQALDYERLKRNSGICALPPRKIIIETNVADDAEVLALREQLAQAQHELVAMQDRVAQAAEEASSTDGDTDEEAAGRTTTVDLLQWTGNQLEFVANQANACLVNLCADPQRGGVLLYLLNLGVTRVGRSRPSAFKPAADIAIDASTIAFDHCCIENIRGDLFIKSLSTEFETLVNGEPVSGRTRLFNGDRVVLGEKHIFRVSNPHCRQMHSEPSDFLQAHSEVLLHRDNRLRDSLEQDRDQQKRLYDELFARLQSDREHLATEWAALDAMRQQLEDPQQHPEEPAKKTRATRPEDDPNASLVHCELLDSIRRLGSCPSDEWQRRIDAQLQLMRQRCAELLAAADDRQLDDWLELSVRTVPAGFACWKLVINIGDLRRDLVAEWPTARMDVWLDRQRQRRSATVDTLFAGFDVHWLTHEEYQKAIAVSPSSSPRPSLVGDEADGVGRPAAVVVGRSDALPVTAINANRQLQQKDSQGRLQFERMTPAKRSLCRAENAATEAEDEEENWVPLAVTPPHKRTAAEQAANRRVRHWPRSPKIVPVVLE